MVNAFTWDCTCMRNDQDRQLHNMSMYAHAGLYVHEQQARPNAELDCKVRVSTQQRNLVSSLLSPLWHQFTRLRCVVVHVTSSMCMHVLYMHEQQLSALHYRISCCVIHLTDGCCALACDKGLRFITVSVCALAARAATFT